MGQLPDLKMFLRKAETNNYCGAEPRTNSTTPVQVAAGGWYKLAVNVSAFDCQGGGGIPLADIDQFGFQNTAIRNALVCIGDVSIDR